MREAGEFILTLFHAATNTHILHLRSRSFSEHMALGTFYQELPELADQLAEAIQGHEQELLDFPAAYYEPAETALDELTQLQDYVEQERKMVLPDATEIQNIVDEIAQLIDSTIYKLKFLK